MTQNDPSPYTPGELPPVVVRYLDAQADTEGRQAIAEAFAPDARVVDEGIEHSGRDAIRKWLASAASEYTYTTTFTGQYAEGAERWVVLARIEGNFPGGVADLRFRIATRGDLISDLVIAP